MTTNTRASIKEYILAQFLPGADPSELTDSTPLISASVLDSLATVQLVAFLEERFRIEIAPHEVSIDNLDTIETMAALVHTKA